MWLYYRRKRGLPEGCYGIYLATREANLKATQMQLRGAQRGITPVTKKRPAWCSEATWRAFRAYRDQVHAGIPLEVYVDPVKRAAWKRKGLLREITPAEARQAAVELLKRKGLAPPELRGPAHG